MNKHQFYEQYEGEKCVYSTYRNRINRGYTREDAILPGYTGRQKKLSDVISEEIKEYYQKYRTLPRPLDISKLHKHKQATVYYAYKKLVDKGVLGKIGAQYTVKDLSFFIKGE